MVCRTPSDRLRNTIADSLKSNAELGEAYIAEVVGERPWEQFTPTHFLAGNIVTEDEHTLVGLWAIGASGEGAIFAVNEPARSFSNWGAAMSPDSRMSASHSTWESYAEAQQVSACLDVKPPGSSADAE